VEEEGRGKRKNLCRLLKTGGRSTPPEARDDVCKILVGQRKGGGEGGKSSSRRGEGWGESILRDHAAASTPIASPCIPMGKGGGEGGRLLVREPVQSEKNSRFN